MQISVPASRTLDVVIRVVFMYDYKIRFRSRLDYCSGGNRFGNGYEDIYSDERIAV